MTTKAYSPHNHSHCIAEAMSKARTICQQQGARLTPVRQRVLELVWESHRPVGAYDLLPQLAAEGFNSAPPTVYRALDFLIGLGLIHRINSLNAYVGCSHPGVQHPNCFFLCSQCGAAHELKADEVVSIATEVERLLGVKVEQQMTELTGICPSCQSSESKA